MTTSPCIHACKFGPVVLSWVKHFNGPEMKESIGSKEILVKEKRAADTLLFVILDSYKHAMILRKM